MATTGLLKGCPACNEEAPKEGLKCLKCGFVIYSRSNPSFDGPAYIAIQIEDKKADLGTKPTADKEKQELDENRVRWFRECSDTDRDAAMDDAAYTLKNLMHSNASVETFKAVVGKARAIGKLAEALDQYVKNGGHLNAIGIPAAPKPDYSEEDTSQTGIVRDPTES